MDQPPVESATGTSSPVDDGKKDETRPSAHVKEASMTESEVTHNSIVSAPHTSRHRQSLNIGRNREENLKNIQFIEPEQGTPAALALAANAAIVVTKFDKGFHKFRGLRRPKLKGLNLVKKLNKTTKAKRDKRHFSKNFKGKVIDGVHELYTLTAGMMLGINHAVSNFAANSGNALTPDDFTHNEAVPFPGKGSDGSSGGYVTPQHSLVHTFQFKTYAPKIFVKLREFFDIDDTSYKQSVCGDYNYIEFISNSKSGQFFFYSHDGRYMLKTQTKEENKFLLSILPQYYEYLRQNPHSLLVRILGMHRINMYHIRRKVHFVIMTSVFDTPAQIHTIYDLKGSLQGREATPKDRESGGVLKDNDLLNDKRKLHLGNKKAPFVNQLRKDAEFLASLNIMDYSLLLGIHDRTKRVYESMVERESEDPMSSTQGDGASTTTSQQLPHQLHSTSSNHNLNSNVNNLVQVAPHSNLPFRRPDNNGMHLQLERVEEEVGSASAVNSPSPSVSLMTRTRSARRSSKASATGTTPNRASISVDGTVAISAPNSPQRESAGGDLFQAHELKDGMETEIILAGGRSPETPIQQHPSTSASVAEENEMGESQTEGEESEEEEEYEDIDEGDSDGDAPNMNSSMLMIDPADANNPNRKPWTSRIDAGINSRVNRRRGNEIYYVGVIDILQQYNVQKRVETMFKGFTNDVRTISAIDPPSYARRFVRFIQDNTD